MIKATLRLFNAIQIDKKSINADTLELLNKTVPYGFVLSPEVASAVDDKAIEEIAKYYMSIKKANQAFHKSWQIIKDTPQEELWLQAIIHYFTTYGYEALGINGEVYIPAEKLDLPDGIRLIVVKGMTKKELKEAIVQLGSGVALGEDTLKAIMEIVEKNRFRIEDKIKNRELKAMLYDLYNIVPKEPVEFLRFLVVKLTEESLLIKSNDLIEKIKSCDSALHQKTLDSYLQQAPANLAEIFFRFKPIFLALKSISKNKTFFNRLRKKADKMHKPMSEDYLNSVTSRIAQGKSLDKLQEKLNKASVWRKIRLANALSFRLSNSRSIVYKIRNGKSWADDFLFQADKKELERVYKLVLRSFQVKKEVYVPKYVDYALPASEKQFLGHLPANTRVKVEDDLIVGIWWKDTKNRIDLDLSAISVNGKVGWDSYYTDRSKGILFSGDMTEAGNGASELLYVANTNIKPYLLFVNYYNFNAKDPVEAKIIVAHEKPANFNRNYVANNIIIQADITIKYKQNFIGLIDGGAVYFNYSGVGDSISSSGSETANKAREYLLNSCLSCVRLSDICKVVEKKKEGVIDLSPEVINKTTFIDLLKGEENEKKRSVNS